MIKVKNETVYEYLSHVSNDELTNRLRYIDECLKELHEHGYYVVCNIADIRIINNQISLQSFKDKLDYLNDGINKNGDKKDILELSSIGICAYNHFDKAYSSVDFISYLIDNLDKYIDNGKLPRIMKDYYTDVFIRGNIKYLSDYLLEIGYDEKQKTTDAGRERGMVKTKSTQAGRLFSEKEAAYAKILLLPAILALVYLIAVVCYFMFFR